MLCFIIICKYYLKLILICILFLACVGVLKMSYDFDRLPYEPPGCHWCGLKFTMFVQ